MLNTMSFASNYGVFVSFSYIASQIYSPFGLTAEDVAINALIKLCSGVLGSLVFSVLLDYTEAYKKTLILCKVASAISLFLVMMSLTHGWSLQTLRYILAAWGFFCFPTAPIQLGLGVEMSFPVQPILVNGVMFIVLYFVIGI